MGKKSDKLTDFY